MSDTTAQSQTHVTAFATNLAAAIAAVLPSGFAISAVGTEVMVQDGELPTFIDVAAFFSEYRDKAESIVSVASSILSSAQDVVIERLTVPWPQDIASSSFCIAMPAAALDGTRLTMWFGQRDAPSLSLADVDVSGLLD